MGVTRVLHGCYKGVTRVLLGCYTTETHCVDSCRGGVKSRGRSSGGTIGGETDVQGDSCQGDSCPSTRQSHPTAPPFQQAMGVPKDMKKSTLDAWNGYHSVEVREGDRHYLTFLTPEGRYRYRTAPQGYMASGDAYTHRYDLITRDVRNMKRVIDDTLLYSEDLEKAYYQVAEYLVLVGRNGIILNPDKFSFGCDEVNWAGFRLTKDKVLPLEEHVEAIRNFPTPVNVTDMRSYWALVNQVSHYYAASPKLAPFRELLKKNVKWYWDDVLQDIFEESRAVIAEEIIKGITNHHLRY